MGHGRPGVAEALASLESWNIQKIQIPPLYPQSQDPTMNTTVNKVIAGNLTGQFGHLSFNYQGLPLSPVENSHATSDHCL